MKRTENFPQVLQEVRMFIFPSPHPPLLAHWAYPHLSAPRSLIPEVPLISAKWLLSSSACTFKLNSDLSLIIRSNTRQAVIRPQSLSPDSCHWQPGLFNRGKKPFALLYLSSKPKKLTFLRATSGQDLCGRHGNAILYILWFLCFGNAENGTPPPPETNHVIFLMSTSFLPIMISCNSFPVSEGIAILLALRLRKKSPIVWVPFRNHRHTDPYCTRFIVSKAPSIITDKMTPVLKPLLRCSGFSFVQIPHHECFGIFSAKQKSVTF